jgi:D-glycero-alpha-D-manno-heptose-7-phosphate kinase
VARAPARLDLGGGWTDVPPYCDEEGGAVCSVAITRYATATVARDARAARGAGAHPAGDDELARAALRRSRIPGAVASLTTDYPAGAGLGGSSACGVALAGALAALDGEELELWELAARSRATEVDGLGVPGGYQDHYAAAYGGALLLSFAGCVGIESLELPDGVAERLARRGVLVYTGQSRLSGDIIVSVRDAYVRRDASVCAALARMRALAGEMAAALRSGDLDTLGSLAGEHWTHQRALHPTITTARIDAIADAAMRAGALGVKGLGASGGGCVLAIAREDGEEELARALAPLGERLDYEIDTEGFRIVAKFDDAHGPAADDFSDAS